MSQLSDSSLNGNPNLLAYYKFNTGALTTDSSGNGRTLTNEGTVGEVAGGKYGYAADFGDPNTSKYFSRSEDIWANGAISFAAWVKRASTDTCELFCCFEADTDKQLYISLSSTQMTGSIYRVGEGYDNVAANCTVDTNWHHYALTLTTGAGGTMKIYQDGVEIGTGSVTNSSGSVGQSDALRIGLGPGNYVEGYMDDVAFFNDVLTATEIAELASSGANFLNLL